MFADMNFIRFCFEGHDRVSDLIRDRIQYMDLTFCIKGKMHYIFEEKDIWLSDGDAILFPQNSYRTRISSDIPSRYCSFNISYSESFKPEISGYLPNCMRSDTLLILESAKKSFFSVSDEKSEKCLSLFFYLYYQLIETMKNNEEPHIKHIKQFVANHLSDNISLEEIAKNVHLTPQYCCSLFSKHAGQTLFDFIAKQRIEYAKGLIITTDSTLTDIAANCGFCDYNYFSRVFKRITGISASKYRLMNKAKYCK